MQGQYIWKPNHGVSWAGSGSMSYKGPIYNPVIIRNIVYILDKNTKYVYERESNGAAGKLLGKHILKEGKSEIVPIDYNEEVIDYEKEWLEEELIREEYKKKTKKYFEMIDKQEKEKKAEMERFTKTESERMNREVREYQEKAERDERERKCQLYERIDPLIKEDIERRYVGLFQWLKEKEILINRGKRVSLEPGEVAEVIHKGQSDDEYGQRLKELSEPYYNKFITELNRLIKIQESLN